MVKTWFLFISTRITHMKNVSTKVLLKYFKQEKKIRENRRCYNVMETSSSLQQQNVAGMSKVYILDKYFHELQKFWETEKRLQGKYLSLGTSSKHMRITSRKRRNQRYRTNLSSCAIWREKKAKKVFFLLSRLEKWL